MAEIEYFVRGQIQLKKPLKAAQDELNELLVDVENKVLKSYKKIDDMDFKSEYSLKDENTLLISLHSFQYPAHMILYRLRKEMAPLMGKKFHIGVGDVRVNWLKIVFPIEKLPKDNEEISVPFVSSLKLDGDDLNCIIEMEDVDSEFITRGNIQRIIKRIKEKIDRTYYEGKAEAHRVLYESPKRDISFNEDPTKIMLERNWIARASTKGKWIYWPPAVALFNAMENIVIDHLLKPLNFQEIINSNVVSGEEVWLRTGHLAGMPMELYYVAEPITRNPAKWETFIDKVKITQKVPYDELAGLLQFKPLKGLIYAQCPPIYWSLKGKTIDESSFPIYVFERTGNSFRYEAGGRHGIERVDEFHRIEVVFIGEPSTLLELHDKIQEKYKYIFNEILELEWRTASVTPFYQQQAGDIFKQEDENLDVKIGTIDYEAWLPYRGSREESEWLEFQNISIVGEKYVNAFNIKHQKGKQLWSGCTGIGLERWVAVFLAQHGFNIEEWPEKFRKYLPDPMPKTLKFH